MASCGNQADLTQRRKGAEENADEADEYIREYIRMSLRPGDLASLR